MNLQLGWEGGVKNGTSATSQSLQEAEQQQSFTKEASRNKTIKRLANRASWRCCGLQTHSTPKLLSSSNVFFCHGPGITPFPRGSTQLTAHSPTVAPRGAGNTVPKEHSVCLNIYSEKNMFLFGSKDIPNEVQVI